MNAVPINRYKKLKDKAITAVQLAMESVSFSYHKWGAEQHCKKGDWVVDNEGDVYTIDQLVFERTYQEVSRGRFVKTTKIWAKTAIEDGVVDTLEGRSEYQSGDYLVSNSEDGSDTYCISKDKFEIMYELDD